jgi:hypothetical protein
MNSNRSIQFKAAFLLAVFGMNTLVGFACSMGADMGFNITHHKEEAVKVQIHIHKDGTKHEHKQVPAKKQQHSPKEATDKKDDCCKEKVVKLQIADKNLDYSQTVINQPVIYLPAIFYQLLLFKIVKGNVQAFIACQFHPPPRDIRIDIQSFQI